MSATTPQIHRLTVSDRREPRLNASPAVAATFDLEPEAAHLLGQLLLQREIDPTGAWQVPIAGGIREVRIDALADAA